MATTYLSDATILHPTKTIVRSMESPVHKTERFSTHHPFLNTSDDMLELHLPSPRNHHTRKGPHHELLTKTPPEYFPNLPNLHPCWWQGEINNLQGWKRCEDHDRHNSFTRTTQDILQDRTTDWPTLKTEEAMKQKYEWTIAPPSLFSFLKNRKDGGGGGTPFDKSVVKEVRLLSEVKNVTLNMKANEAITTKAESLMKEDYLSSYSDNPVLRNKETNQC